MDAMRCKDCGDVRWSFMGLKSRHKARCELCGGVTLPERRRPHRGPIEPQRERRGMFPPHSRTADPTRPAAR
jgi:hypothetical protein